VTPNQIHISASSRGIVDHFFCFSCDEYVWDCDHLIDKRLHAPRVPVLEPSSLQSFAYDGTVRVLEIEFRVTTPYAYDELPMPPPPTVIQYRDVPRYVFTKLLSSKTARQQERYWESHIRTRFRCQTVRTVCRLPRIFRFCEARNVRRHSFGEYLHRRSSEERQALPLLLAAMKLVLLRTLAPKQVAGLGGLMECQSCGTVGATVANMRHRNCLWLSLESGPRVKVPGSHVRRTDL
jgi:hypothetical protein